jgi:hypothetical protein
MHPAFAADARLLRAAEGRAQVAQEPAVDPGDAHLDTRRHPVGAGQVGGPDRGGEAVVGVVGQGHHLVLAVEGADVAARAEDLLLHHGCGFGQTGPDGGLHPGTLGQLAGMSGTPPPVTTVAPSSTALR